MHNKLFFISLFLALFVGEAGAVTPTPTSTATATATATSTATPTIVSTSTPSSTPTPQPVSQSGYKPYADWYGYRYYIFSALPNPPGAGFGTVLECYDCTKLNPTTQGVQNNPPISCIWMGHWDCSGGLIWGRCLDLGTVTTPQVINFNDSSCKRVHTATSGLAYWIVPPTIPDENFELDSYIGGAITGPLFLPASGSIKWLGGVAPVSSGTANTEDILYFKWDGSNIIETGEALGVK